MKIETQPREDNQVKLIVELDTVAQNDYMRRAAREISRKVKIPGFRPGKAPFDIVKRQIGEKQLEQQAIEMMLDEVYPQALKEANVEPSDSGNLEEYPTLNPPKFTFIVPLKPEIILGDYQSIRQEYNLEPVTETEVNRVLRRLQISHAIAEPVDNRPAQENDMVYIKLDGRLTQPGENDVAEVVKEQSLSVVISQDDEDEGGGWPYPGFYKELINLSANDEKTVNYTYPEDSSYEKLRNKEVEFKITVQSIKALQLPELNDEFAKAIGENYTTLEALTTAVREQLSQNKKTEYDNKYMTELMDKIIAMSSVKYAPHMLEHEIEDTKKNFENNLARRRMDLATYLKTVKKEEKDFIETEIKPAAQRQLIRSLVLSEVMSKEQIKVTQEEINAAVGQTLQEMGSLPGFDNLPRGTRVDNLVQLATYETANRLLNQRLSERLKQIAIGQTTESETSQPQATETEISSDTAETNEAPVETAVSVSESSPSEAEPANETAQSDETALENNTEPETK